MWPNTPVFPQNENLRDGFGGAWRRFPNRQGNGKSRGMIWLNTKLHEIDEALQEILNDSVWLDCNVSRVKGTWCWWGPSCGKCQVHGQGVWALKSLIRGSKGAVKHWEQHNYWGCSRFHHFSFQASNYLSIHTEIWTKQQQQQYREYFWMCTMCQMIRICYLISSLNV